MPRSLPPSSDPPRTHRREEGSPQAVNRRWEYRDHGTRSERTGSRGASSRSYRASPGRFITSRAASRSSLDSRPRGNPNKIPRMVPTRDWAPPPFGPFRDGNLIGHTPGAGTDESPGALRATDRSINSVVPFGKDMGACVGGGFELREPGLPDGRERLRVERDPRGHASNGKSLWRRTCLMAKALT